MAVKIIDAPVCATVRTGEAHGIPEDEATVDQWEVDPLPTVDFAARALREAQERWFRNYDGGGRYAPSDLIWTLRKRES